MGPEGKPVERLSPLPERTPGGRVPALSGCVGFCEGLELLQPLCDHEETR